MFYVTLNVNLCDKNLNKKLPDLLNYKNILWCFDNQITLLKSLPENLQKLNTTSNINIKKGVFIFIFYDIYFNSYGISFNNLPMKIQEFYYRSNNKNIISLQAQDDLPIVTHSNINHFSKYTFDFMVFNYNTTILDLRGLNLKKLPNLSKYKNLRQLWCSHNHITSLDNLPDTLEVLWCSHNRITSLDNLPKNLNELCCGFNQITSLDHLPMNLKKLYSCNMHSEIATVEHRIKFEKNGIPFYYSSEYYEEERNYSDNQITSLNHLPVHLQILSCSNNNITSLDNLPMNITELSCSYNNITSLDNLPANVEHLYCNNNQITSLDNLPVNLIQLSCVYNNITSLDNLPANLRELYCSNNEITSLDNIPANLQYIHCLNNPFLSNYDYPITIENIETYKQDKCQEQMINPLFK